MLHGERKTKGGKLVKVDLTVRNERLSQVMISGDFFLEPPDTLEALAAALAGASASASRADLTARLDAAVPVGAELIGVSTEAIAIATLRALGADEEGS